MRVCFLGTGKMGAAMCQRLAEKGHSVTAWNRTHARAVAMRDGSEHRERIEVPEVLHDAVLSTAADDAHVIGVLLCTDDVLQLIDTAEGASPGVWKGRTFVNLTSGNPDDGRKVGARLAAAGIGHYIDGAYSGAPSKARAGAGTLFLSSDDKARTDTLIEGVLSAIGTPVWAGPVGASRALDYAVVDQALASFVSWSANLSMLEKEGVPHELVMRCLEQRLATVPAVLTALHARMGDRSDAAYGANPVATVDTWLNFTASRIPYFEEHGMSTVVPEHLAGLLRRLSAAGHGGDDMTRMQELTRYTDRQPR